MAWTLQPRSYYQAMRPNFYDIAYRRTGAYKGMGWLGQDTTSTTPITGGTCPGTPGCPGYVDPYQNLSTATEGVLSGQNVLMTTGAFNQLTQAGATQQPAGTTPPWLVPLLAVVAVLALVGGRR